MPSVQLFAEAYATKIYRPFGRYLAAGDVFSFRFKDCCIAWYTDEIQPGAGAGVCAIDGDDIDDDCGFRFYFNGGQTVYETPYGNTPIAWTNIHEKVDGIWTNTAPIDVLLSMETDTRFAATFTTNGVEACTIQGEFTKPCNAFRAWSWSNKENNDANDYDVFVDNLSLGKLVYETTTAKAVLVYNTGDEDIYVTTTSPVVTSVNAAAGTLSFNAEVDAPDGTSIDVYTTDTLVGEDGGPAPWTKAKTVIVSAGMVALKDLDLGEGNLYISIGKPGGK